MRETGMKKTLDILSPVLIYYTGYYTCGILLAVIGMTAASLSAAAAVWMQQNVLFLSNLKNAGSMLGGAGLLLPFYASAPIENQEKENQEKESQEEHALLRYKYSAQAAHLTEQKAEKSKPHGCFPGYVRLAILFASCALGMNILFARLHITEAASYEQTAQLQYQLPFLAGLLIYGLISPFAEELLFRGCIYRRMKKYLPIKVALLLSACLFGLYHGNPVQTLYGTVLGIGITCVYELSGKLKTAVFVHGIANTAVFACTYDAARAERLGTWSACAVCFLLFFLTLWSVKGVLDSCHGISDRRQQEEQDSDRTL